MMSSYEKKEYTLENLRISTLVMIRHSCFRSAGWRSHAERRQGNDRTNHEDEVTPALLSA